jgi:hypothetical protein
MSTSSDSHALGMIIVGVVSKYCTVITNVSHATNPRTPPVMHTNSAYTGHLRHDQGGEVFPEATSSPASTGTTAGGGGGTDVGRIDSRG